MFSKIRRAADWWQVMEGIYGTIIDFEDFTEAEADEGEETTEACEGQTA